MARLIPMVILLLFTGVSLGANLVKHGQNDFVAEEYTDWFAGQEDRLYDEVMGK
jgi:hypothetical protein